MDPAGMTKAIILLGILAVATTEQVNIHKQDQVVDAVVFEPLHRIRLSLSTFQVISTFSFKPYHDTLLSLMAYIAQLALDVDYCIYAPENRRGESRSIPEIKEIPGADVTYQAQRKIIHNQWRDLKSIVMEYIDILDLMKDDPNNNDIGNLTSQHHEIPITMHCMELLMIENAPILDYRSSPSPTTFKEYCGCMIYHKRLNQSVPTCRTESLRSYILAMRKIGITLNAPARSKRELNQDTAEIVFQHWEEYVRTGNMKEFVKVVGIMKTRCPQQPEELLSEERELCKLLQLLEEGESRDKRVIETVLLGIYTHLKFRHTDKSIKHVIKNLEILEKNEHLNHHDILQAYNLINLTMIEMGQHRHVIHDLEKEVLQHQHIIDTLAHNISLRLAYTHTVEMLTTKSETFQNTLSTYQRQTDKLRRYLTAISTRKLTPSLISPRYLREILRYINQHLVERTPKLSLLGYPDTNIWEFYQIITLVPVMAGDHLIVALQVPLSDATTQFQIYKINNFPLLHPNLGIRFTYKLENDYLAISTNRTFFMLPPETEVTLCRATQGQLCRLTHPLFAVNRVSTCVTSLFFQKHKDIEENCEVIPHPQSHPTAVMWRPNAWIISVFQTTSVSIICASREETEFVEPPHALLTVPATCTAWVGMELYLPASAQLNMDLPPSELGTAYLTPELTYRPMKDYRLFEGWNGTRLSEQELEKQSTNLLTYDAIPFPTLRDTIQKLDTNYPKPGILTTWVDTLVDNIHIVAPSAAIVALGAAILLFLYKFYPGMLTKIPRYLLKRRQKRQARAKKRQRQKHRLRLKNMNSGKTHPTKDLDTEIPAPNPEDSEWEWSDEEHDYQEVGPSPRDYVPAPGSQPCTPHYENTGRQLPTIHEENADDEDQPDKPLRDDSTQPHGTPPISADKQEYPPWKIKPARQPTPLPTKTSRIFCPRRQHSRRK